MYLQEKIKEVDKGLKVFEIKDRNNLWTVSVYRDKVLEYSVQGSSLPHIYKNVIDKYGISNKS